ncbi:alpha/beta hydrolase-fold protein [Spirillospora sp. NPDC052269]
MARHRKSPERRGLPRAAHGGIAVLVALLLTATIVVGVGRVRHGLATGGHTAAEPDEPPPALPAHVGAYTSKVRLPDEKTARDLVVYRPNVPDSSKLPVVYFLHGVPGDPRTLVDDGLVDELRKYLARGGQPFVLAVPDGNGDHHDDTEWADAADGSDRVETRLLRAVIPAVEGDRPRDAGHRAIAGFSMGGYGALNLGLRHPDLFGQVVSLAGYYGVDDPDHMFGGREDLEAANSPDRHLDAAKQVRIFMAVGQDDGNPVVEGSSQQFKRLLDAAHVPATLQVLPGEHDWDFVTRALPAGFDFLRQGWARNASTGR